MISIAGLNKAEVLAALYNAARPQGMGFMQYQAQPMHSREAEEILSKQTSFDYLNGRVMKISFKDGDELEERLYDRDNGAGTAARVIAELRAGRSENSPVIRMTHDIGKVTAAQHAETAMAQTSGVTREQDGTATFRLGLAEVADELRPAIEKALGKKAE